MPLKRHLLAVSLSALAFVHGARADAIELSWQAPPECPSRDGVVQNVTRLAGSKEGLALVANLVVARTAENRWRVTIDLSGSATGHRELTADSCAQLARAAALIIALAANPEAALDLPTEPPTSVPQSTPQTSAPSGSPGNEANPEPSPAPPIQAQEARLKETEKRSSGIDSARLGGQPPPGAGTKLLTFAGIGYDHGSLPAGAGLVRLGGTLSRAPLELSLALDLTAPSRAEFVGGYGARLRAIGAELLGCFAPTRGKLHVAACLGPRGEVLLVKGYGTIADQFRYAPRFSAAAGAEFSVPLSERIQAGLLGELLLFLSRPSYVIENIDTVLYRPQWFALRAVFSIAHSF